MINSHYSGYTLWQFIIAIEHESFSLLIYLLKLVMFNSYVSLPEGTLIGL